MKLLIINPPHLAIGSRLAGEHLPPLGLLSIAGPLIDDGHEVIMLDADYHNYSLIEITERCASISPDLVLMGHSGSTSAQPIIEDLARRIKCSITDCTIAIGGVFPTYHWNEILVRCPEIDYIVCGEGEESCRRLVRTLTQGGEMHSVSGIALRINGLPSKTKATPLIHNLDAYRIGWELMQEYNYTYWGRRKAVVVQFSRGCPYPCSYCGQSIFWEKWRHRNPQKFADEMEYLHRTYGISVFNFADENPSTNPRAWREVLEAIIAKNLNVILVGSIRADNIVRDADFLHLYKKAGFERFLLGIENYDDNVLSKINKASTLSKDREAIQLLRRHGILSMATYVVGFGDEKTRDFYHNLRQLLSYDPDQIQLLYATPHKWTPYFEEVKEREIILPDQRYWDYKHQVLATKYLAPWVVLLYVKLTELILQARPKAIVRNYFNRNASLGRAMRWYSNIGKRVWFWEIYQFFFLMKSTRRKMQLREFWK
jgi:anaerobic magnesium-protoporphyrin IX monomethyl ester cyclase